MKIPNMNQLMKQAQQFQSKMSKLQEELEKETVEASAGGGMVNVVVSGKQEVLSISIDPEVIDPEDVEMLQDLILAAVNDGLARSREMVNQRMSELTGGMNIPGLTGMM
jgi:hypothetical protein